MLCPMTRIEKALQAITVELRAGNALLEAVRKITSDAQKAMREGGELDAEKLETILDSTLSRLAHAADTFDDVSG
jgi:hypothetical protein